MKVLFTCLVGHGHFSPLMPLAPWRRPAIASRSPRTRLVGRVREVGFEAHPAGLDQAEALTRFVAATPGWAQIAAQDRMPVQFPGLLEALV